MRLFHGSCPSCSYCWVVEGRVPNYCPECGMRQFNNAEQLLAAKERVRETEPHNVVSSEEVIRALLSEIESVCTACLGKGWILAHNDTHGLRIERCDLCQKIDTDELAVRVVAALAIVASFVMPNEELINAALGKGVK